MMLKTLQRSKLTPEISGWRGGDGPSMMLIHGVGLRAEAWVPIIPFLERDFSLTVVDLPGHGGSPCFSDTPKLADYTSAIAEVLQTCDGPSFVVGHSMGALIALDLAVNHQNLISKVAPLNAIFRRTDDAKNAVLQRAEEIRTKGNSDATPTLARWFGDAPQGDDAAHADACRKWLTEVDPMGYSHAYSIFAQEEGPSKNQLGEITCDCLFMTGAQEPNSTPEMSHALAKRVSSGRAVIIENAKHMMPMTHAEMVGKQLLEFHHKKGAVVL